MAYEYVTQRRVEFAETDMAGILHFSNYFRYMESAEHEFFRSLGLRVHTESESGAWGWARGRAECSFLQPLRYEDVVDLHLLVSEKRRKSITYQVVFRTTGSSDAEPTVLARGSMTVVCVGKPDGEARLRAIDMPADVDALLEVAPAALLATVVDDA